MWRRKIPVLLWIDLTVCAIVSFIGFNLYEDGSRMNALVEWVLFTLSFGSSIIFLMYRYNLYHRLWKYSSIGELVSIFKAITFGSLMGSVIFGVLRWDFMDPYPFLLAYQSLLLLLGGVRFALRLSNDNYHRKGTDDVKVLIIGAGDCGTMVAKEIKQNKYLNNSYPVGYIDDNPLKQMSRVTGLRVLGTREDISRIVEEHKINHIIIAMPSASRKDISEIVSICKEMKCMLKIVPKLDDILQGKVTASQVRNVEVEDLLGRAPVAIDLDGIANYVEGKIVLVTGAGGSIGSELCRQIAPFKPKLLLLLGHGENSIYLIDSELQKKFPELEKEPIIADVQNNETIMNIFRRYRPEVVFHAAAHKHVPLMERNPFQAVLNNVIGTRNVAQASNAMGVERFVLISTDKAVNPTSVMGATKRLAEIVIQTMSRTSRNQIHSLYVSVNS